ncbi:hypothetical protein LMG26842_04242 [Achromobacter dolens]|nr:hypothetical protein LMG26842_04242 [Achromobacter dolens]
MLAALLACAHAAGAQDLPIPDPVSPSRPAAPSPDNDFKRYNAPYESPAYTPPRPHWRTRAPAADHAGRRSARRLHAAGRAARGQERQR